MIFLLVPSVSVDLVFYKEATILEKRQSPKLVPIFSKNKKRKMKLDNLNTVKPLNTEPIRTEQKVRYSEKFGFQNFMKS